MRLYVGFGIYLWQLMHHYFDNYEIINFYYNSCFSIVIAGAIQMWFVGSSTTTNRLLNKSFSIRVHRQIVLATDIYLLIFLLQFLLLSNAFLFFTFYFYIGIGSHLTN